MSQDAIEREVQKRLTARLVAAGVRQGEISLQVLFMLPPEFVREYERLFYASLTEDSTAKPGAGGREGGQPKAVPSKLRGTAGSMHARDGGGKRYRTYWSIKNEEALKRKGSIDRKLLRLVRDMREMREDTTAIDPAAQCPHCSGSLKDALMVLGATMRFCPLCGKGVSVNGLHS